MRPTNTHSGLIRTSTTRSTKELCHPFDHSSAHAQSLLCTWACYVLLVRTAKVLARLRICAVSLELRCSHMYQPPFIVSRIIHLKLPFTQTVTSLIRLSNATVDMSIRESLGFLPEWLFCIAGKDALCQNRVPRSFCNFVQDCLVFFRRVLVEPCCLHIYFITKFSLHTGTVYFTDSNQYETSTVKFL